MATNTERFGFTLPSGQDPASIIPLNLNTQNIEKYLGMTQDMLAPLYDATEGTYEVDDIVTHDSVLYKCIEAVETPEAFDETKWVPTTATQEGGGAGAIEKTQAEYNELTPAQKLNGAIYMVSPDEDTIVELTEAQTDDTRVTASSYGYDSNFQQYHRPWCAFNRVSPTTWSYPTPGVTNETAWVPNIGTDGSNSWIRYEFDKAENMTSMKILAFADYSSSTTKSMIIEGSNDGETWDNILAEGSSFTLTATLHENYENEVDLDPTNAYKYVRLRSLEPMGASYQPSVFIDEIYVYGYGAIDDVHKIYYMGTEYANTNGSSGGSGSSYSETAIFEGLTASTDSGVTVNLDGNISNYDAIIIECGRQNDGVWRRGYIWYPTSGITIGQSFLQMVNANDNTTAYWTYNSDTSITWQSAYAAYPVTLFSIKGIKFGGGGGSSVEYSTVEKEVGTWIDGSKLYEKTIYAPTISGTGSTTIDSTLTLSNTNFILVESMFYAFNGYVEAVNMGFEVALMPYGVAVYVDSASPSYRSGITDMYVTIRYTKVVS